MADIFPAPKASASLFSPCLACACGLLLSAAGRNEVSDFMVRLREDAKADEKERGSAQQMIQK